MTGTAPTLVSVEERAFTPHLDLAVRDLLTACFPRDAAHFAQTRWWNGCAPAWTVVAVDGARAVACAAGIDRVVRCGGQPVRVAGLGNFCVAAERRGTGLARRVMDRFVKEAAGRGFEFGMLLCSPGLTRFYQSLGWHLIPLEITAVDEQGRDAPLPAGNQGMARSLEKRPWPDGPVHLTGRDW